MRLQGDGVFRFGYRRFKEKGLQLTWQGAQTSAWILADGRRIEQVIDNLLVNALRYVPAGGQVTVSMQSNSPKPAQLRIEDDGSGVPEHALAHLFDRFYRADGQRGTSGTGLGLAIVKAIIKQHGGQILAANRRPRGLSFIIELPVYEGDLNNSPV